MSTTMMASTNRMCTNPPKVYEVTKPKAHKITRMIAIVQSRSIFSSQSSHSRASIESLHFQARIKLGLRFNGFRNAKESHAASGCGVAGVPECALRAIGYFTSKLLRILYAFASPPSHGLAASDRIIDAILRGVSDITTSVLTRLRREKQPERRTGTQADGECRRYLGPLIAIANHHEILLPTTAS